MDNYTIIQEGCDYICVGEYIVQMFWYTSTILYILVLVVLIYNKKTTFNTSFWTLCISVGISDMNSLGISQFYRLVQWGYFNSILLENPCLSAWLIIIADRSAVLIQVLGVVILSLNRYTEMKQLTWSPKVQALCITLQWVVPFFMIIPLYQMEFTLVTNIHNTNVGLLIVTANESVKPSFAKWYLTCIIGFGIIRVIFLFYLYGSMFYKAHKVSRALNATRAVEHGAEQDNFFNKREFKLAFVGFVLVFLDFLSVCHGISVFVHILTSNNQVNPELLRRWNFRSRIVMDLLGYSNPYLLIFFSTLVQKSFAELYFCKKQLHSGGLQKKYYRAAGSSSKQSYMVPLHGVSTESGSLEQLGSIATADGWRTQSVSNNLMVTQV